ncbi:Transmembrane protein 94 [Eumeta japonica]|uniref:Transmembrane protein 94 n=1 Tax=Eumeta variegata TaxID=151549 RepID=A0A4C1YQH4_EUMVA|nr:Transmembrane protein 94 [Eumeta japonica]
MVCIFRPSDTGFEFSLTDGSIVPVALGFGCDDNGLNDVAITSEVACVSRVDGAGCEAEELGRHHTNSIDPFEKSWIELKLPHIPTERKLMNSAKLPRGIENIRPHIEKVDNVPLLVSLFTDCTARSVNEMIGIMQDYAEVVCVMGSAANCLNMEIFMRADASIAVEPLYPVLCQKMPPYELPEDCIGPIDLARKLNSIPCSLSLARDADVSLFALITMSRHYMMCLWNCTQYWICSVCFISLTQVCSVSAFQPVALSVGGALWASAAAALLAASLPFAPLDTSVMQRAATRPHLTLTYKACIILHPLYLQLQNIENATCFQSESFSAIIELLKDRHSHNP